MLFVVIVYCSKAFSPTCVVTPPTGLWCVAAASEVVQTQHISSAPWSVSATVLDVSIILERVIKAVLLKKIHLKLCCNSILYQIGAQRSAQRTAETIAHYL